MIKQEFLILDAAVGEYTLFQQLTIESGVRYFRTLVESTGNPINAHPSDYTLFHRGEYDTETGLSVCSELRPNLGNGLEFTIRREEKAGSLAEVQPQRFDRVESS